MAISFLAPSPAAVLRLGLVSLLLLFAGVAPAQADAPPWQWPLPPPHQVIAPFEAPEHRYGPGHRGIDIAAPVAGVVVRAVAPGTVRFSGMVAGRGVVSVTHADGLISTYEPVTGTVVAGDQVDTGTTLGTLVDKSELSHCPGTECLHLGARRGEDYVDPLLLLGGRGPSVLLPWADGRSGVGGAGGVQPPTGPGASPVGGTSPRLVPSGVRGDAETVSENGSGTWISGGGVRSHRPGLRQASRA